MGTREEIEAKLEEELAPQIKEAVERFRGDLELQAMKMGPLGRSKAEIDALVRKKEEEIKRELMRPQDRDNIERGFGLLMEKVDAMPERQRVHAELGEAANRYESIKDKIGTGPSVQELLGISKETYDLFYSIAFKQFSDGYDAKEPLKDVVSMLMYLTSLNEYIFEPHLLLGYTHQTLDNYEEAMRAYADAASLKPKEFEPRIRPVECLIALNRKEEAREELERLEKELEGPGQTDNLDIVRDLKLTLHQHT